MYQVFILHVHISNAVHIIQFGIAPFYYLLSLTPLCVTALVNEEDAVDFTVSGDSAASSCPKRYQYCSLYENYNLDKLSDLPRVIVSIFFFHFIKKFFGFV